MDWKTRGFDSELEYSDFLMSLADSIEKLDPNEYDRLRTSGTKAEILAAISQPRTISQPESKENSGNVSLTKPESKENSVPSFPQGMGEVVRTLDPLAAYDREAAKAVEQAQRTEDSRSVFRPITPEDMKDPEKVAQIARDLPDIPTTDLGERVGPWYEWFATPSPSDSVWSFFNPLRPQIVMTSEDAQAYDEARNRGDYSTFRNTLFDALTNRTHTGEVVASSPAWVMRLLNILSALAAKAGDLVGSFPLGATSVPLSERISKGEGVGDLAREAATGVMYGERFPDTSVAGENYTVPEVGAFVLGSLVDLAIPMDLGLGELGKAGRSALGFSKAGRVLKDAMIAAKDPANLDVTREWLAHIEAGTEIPKDLATKAESLGLPIDRTLAQEFIAKPAPAPAAFSSAADAERALAEAKAPTPADPAVLLERAVGRKVADTFKASPHAPYGETRIGNILVSDADALKIGAILHRDLDPVMSRVTVEEGKVSIPPDAMAELKKITEPMDSPVALGTSGTMTIEDWNTLVGNISEMYASKAPSAIDLRKVEDVNPQRLTPQEVRVNTITQSVMSDDLVNALNPAPTLQKNVAAGLVQALDTAKQKLGAVGQDIMHDIRLARKMVKDTHGAFSQVVHDAFKLDPNAALTNLFQRIYGDAAGDAIRVALRNPDSPISQIRDIIVKGDPTLTADRLARIAAASRGHKLGAFLGDHPDFLKIPDFQQYANRLPLEGVPTNPYYTVIGMLVHQRQSDALVGITRELLQTANRKASQATSSYRVRATNVKNMVDGLVADVLPSVPTSAIGNEISQFVADLFGTSLLAGMHDAVPALDNLVKSLMAKGVSNADAEKLAFSIETSREIRDMVNDTVRLSHTEPLPKEVVQDICKQAVSIFHESDTTLTPLQQEFVNLINPENTLNVDPYTMKAMADGMLRITDTAESAAAVWEAMGGHYTLTPAGDIMAKEIRAIAAEDLIKVLDENEELARQVLPYATSILVNQTKWNPSVAFPARVWNTVSNMARQGMLAGFILPNFAYHAANIMSAPGIMATTIGLAASVKSTVTLLDKGFLANRIAYRLRSLIAQTTAGYPTFLGHNVFTINGKVYTDEYLIKLAIRNGLYQGQQTTEFASSLMDDLLRYARRNLDGSSTEVSKGDIRGWLKENLDPNTETWAAYYANQTDFHFKLSVMTQALLAGRSEQEAIQLAQKALFDFSSISQFERDYISKWWWFYSFSRHSFLQSTRAIFGSNRGKQLFTIMQTPIKAQQLRTATGASSVYVQMAKDDERNSPEAIERAKYTVPLWSDIYANRMPLAEMQSKKAQEVVRLYGPPITAMDALLAIDTIGGMIAQGSGNYSLDSTVGEGARTILGHMHPIFGTMIELALSDVAPVTVGFGDIQYKGKGVDPKVVMLLQAYTTEYTDENGTHVAMPIWDMAAHAWGIRTIRPGDKDFPKEHHVAQLAGNEYYVIDDTANRVRFRAWSSRLPMMLGQERALRDTISPAVLYYRMRNDPNYATLSQSQYPDLKVDGSIMSAITALNLAGLVKLGESTETTDTQKASGRYLDATQTLKE